MSNTILQKCLAELEKDNPRIDYIRGMLETLIELQPGKEVSTQVIKSILKPAGIGKETEARMIEAGASGVDKIRQLARMSGAEL